MPVYGVFLFFTPVITKILPDKYIYKNFIYFILFTIIHTINVLTSEIRQQRRTTNNNPSLQKLKSAKPVITKIYNGKTDFQLNIGVSSLSKFHNQPLFKLQIPFKRCLKAYGSFNRVVRKRCG